VSTNLQIFFSFAFGERTKQPPLFSVIASRGVGGLDVVFVLFIEYLPFQEDTTRA
jgi:hypothetical protein